MKYLKLFARVICIGLIAWYMYKSIFLSFHSMHIMFPHTTPEYYMEWNNSLWFFMPGNILWVMIYLLGMLLIGAGGMYLIIHGSIIIVLIAFGRWDSAKEVFENRIKNIK